MKKTSDKLIKLFCIVKIASLFIPDVDNVFIKIGLIIIYVWVAECIQKKIFYHLRKEKYENKEEKDENFYVKYEWKENVEEQTAQISLYTNELVEEKFELERLWDNEPLIESPKYMIDLSLMLSEKDEEIHFQRKEETLKLGRLEFAEKLNECYEEIFCRNELDTIKIGFLDERGEPFRTLTVDKNGSINIFVNPNERMNIEGKIGDWLNRVNGRQTYIE